MKHTQEELQLKSDNDLSLEVIADLQQQLLEANAKLAQIKESAKWLDKHVEFDMGSNGSIYNEAAYEKLMFEIDETPAQSLALHDADVIEDTVLHKCVFPKGSITVAGIHALTEYADSLRKSIKEGEK